MRSLKRVWDHVPKVMLESVLDDPGVFGSGRWPQLGQSTRNVEGHELSE
jgi:hypothetical protein